MSDRRCSTAPWQRLRRAVLARDGHSCQIRGPRCRGYASTAHHVLPSSTHPHLFFQPSNVVAACGACNFGEGAAIAAGNRRAAAERIAELQQRNWHLEQAVEELERRCEELALALAAARSNPTGKLALNGRNRRSTSPIASSGFFRTNAGPIGGRFF